MPGPLEAREGTSLWHGVQLKRGNQSMTASTNAMNAMNMMHFTELRVSSKYRCFSDGIDWRFNISLRSSFHPIEIFRDHGFIEGMPQSWAIKEADIEMEVEEDGDVIQMLFARHNCFFHLQENELGEIKVDFDAMEEFKKDLQWQHHVSSWFRKHLRRLNRLRNIGLDQYDHEIPQHEWNSIWAFHKAYTDALKYVITDVEKRIQNFEDDGSCSAFESLNINHYDDFREEQDAIQYNEQICDSSEFTDFLSYQPYAEENSNYQTMLWQHRSEDDDMCLHLDGMLQICSSYRPHYHELFVQYPARYMDSIRCVMFLGSGDVMLLHEILKYPDLEKVVGLELDQQVTRKSFKITIMVPLFAFLVATQSISFTDDPLDGVEDLDGDTDGQRDWIAEGSDDGSSKRLHIRLHG